MGTKYIHPFEVAKVILQAVTPDNNPDFSYVVGKDAAMMLETRRVCQTANFKTLSGNNNNNNLVLAPSTLH